MKAAQFKKKSKCQTGNRLLKEKEKVLSLCPLPQSWAVLSADQGWTSLSLSALAQFPSPRGLHVYSLSGITLIPSRRMFSSAGSPGSPAPLQMVPPWAGTCQTTHWTFLVWQGKLYRLDSYRGGRWGSSFLAGVSQAFPRPFFLCHHTQDISLPIFLKRLVAPVSVWCGIYCATGALWGGMCYPWCTRETLRCSLWQILQPF